MRLHIEGLAVIALAILPVATHAATITNTDDTDHVLVVSEGGSQSEVAIRAGETIEICPTGCFVTMPNGDREVLTGTETLEIEASRGKIF